MSQTGPEAGADGASRPGRLGAAADKVPTKWLMSSLSGVFLAATAAFGGMDAVELPELPAIVVGEAHRNDQLEFTVERAVLIDELPEAGVWPEAGERVLAVIGTFENVWDHPIHMSTLGTGGQIVRLSDDPERAPEMVVRLDDSTLEPWLQPGVPAPLVLAWRVDAQEYAAGDELPLDLRDMTLRTGTMVRHDQYWTEPQPAASLTVPVTDAGTGA